MTGRRCGWRVEYELGSVALVGRWWRGDTEVAELGRPSLRRCAAGAVPPVSAAVDGAVDTRCIQPRPAARQHASGLVRGPHAADPVRRRRDGPIRPAEIAGRARRLRALRPPEPYNSDPRGRDPATLAVWRGI